MWCSYSHDTFGPLRVRRVLPPPPPPLPSPSPPGTNHLSQSAASVVTSLRCKGQSGAPGRISALRSGYLFTLGGSSDSKHTPRGGGGGREREREQSNRLVVLTWLSWRCGWRQQRRSCQKILKYVCWQMEPVPQRPFCLPNLAHQIFWSVTEASAFLAFRTFWIWEYVGGISQDLIFIPFTGGN